VEIPNRRVWARRLVAVWILAGALASLTGESAVLASGQPPPQAPRQQDEFVPVDQLPSQEQLPATPLVTIAYAAAWLVIFGYLWSIWRRLGRVERDLAEVGRRVQDSGRR
jgi:CcmD family protein